MPIHDARTIKVTHHSTLEIIDTKVAILRNLAISGSFNKEATVKFKFTTLNDPNEVGNFEI